MWPMIGLAALQAGASFISSKGAADSVAKNNRLQMMEDQRVWEQNYALARELMEIPEVTRANVEEFMAAGEKAGYNPVTWLNSGALSLFKTTTGHNTAAAMAMMTRQPTQLQRVPSALEGLGGALSAGLNTFSSLYQTQMKLDAISGGSGVTGGANYRPPSPGTGGLYNVADVMSSFGFAPRSYSTGGGAASGTAGLSNLPYPGKWEQGKVEVTNPFQSWLVDSKSADAGTMEQRYGEIVENLYGLYSVANDAILNWSGTSGRDWVAAAYGWLGGKSAGGFNGSVKPYIPFPGGGRGITYAW